MTIDRRHFLSGAAAAALAGCSTPGSNSTNVATPKLAAIDVSTAEENLRNVMRVLGYEGGGDVLYWFHGFIYAVKPEGRPFPILHFNGVNAMRFVQHDDGAYSSTHDSISFMEDIETHELLESWVNPITKETLQPKPNAFRGSVYDYTVKGSTMRRGNNSTVTRLHPGMWTFGPESAWVTIDRPYAETFQFPWSEARTYEVEMSDLNDSSNKRLLNRMHSSVTMPFSRWMNMEPAQGHTMWQANGRKLNDASGLPDHILERCKTYLPEIFDYDVFK